ncbi:hypothetical protein [Pseudomonas extremaustralis]|uniref:hypothetical protein n=1 Tax=Pseudomonas extremaustralis TaxID=359110 RepID=UPI002AA90329|nr:hypothetical protein [Pseudomonas extremaustralis]
MNPPISAIKDRLIGGFGGKSKVSYVNYRLGHQAGVLGSACLTTHDQRLLQPQQKACFNCFQGITWTMMLSVLRSAHHGGNDEPSS